MISESCKQYLTSPQVSDGVGVDVHNRDFQSRALELIVLILSKADC